MYNIQRNFFIENILRRQVLTILILKIPYKSYIADINNNNLSLIFLDLDRIKNINFIKNNILKIKKGKLFNFNTCLKIS